MASVAEITGEEQENQTILRQNSDLGNEALGDIKQKAKLENTKGATLWGLKKLNAKRKIKLDFVVTLNGVFHNYLSLYISDNYNDITFVGSLFLCGPCSNTCTLALLRRKCYYAGHK